MKRAADLAEQRQSLLIGSRYRISVH